MSKSTRSLRELALPEIELTQLDSMVSQVHERTRSLSEAVGVLSDNPLAQKIFDEGRFALLSALTHPDATVEQVTLVNDFCAYAFNVDDQAEEDEDYSKQPEFLKLYFERHVCALRSGELLWDGDRAARILVDLRTRILEMASPEWLERFASNVEDYLLRGTLKGAEHWAAGSIPDLDTYETQRGFDVAMYVAQDMIEICGGCEISDELYGRADFKRVRELCTRVVAFTNDLVSYTKEVKRNQSLNNLVHVIMNHEGIDLDAAISRVIDIINRDVEEFEMLGEQVLASESGNAVMQRAFGSYMRGQRAWMKGNLI